MQMARRHHQIVHPRYSVCRQEWRRRLPQKKWQSTYLACGQESRTRLPQKKWHLTYSACRQEWRTQSRCRYHRKDHRRLAREQEMPQKDKQDSACHHEEQEMPQKENRNNSACRPKINSDCF